MKNISSTQYTLIKLPLQELITQRFDVHMDRAAELEQEYRITQENSLLLDQIERLRGRTVSHIEEVILVVAKKNPKQETALRNVLKNGFYYNGIHYARFGKSASQGKDGITAFVCDSIYDELYRITQMDIPVEECIISKYEAQRCLIFSSCTLIHDYMPNIIIIGEYEKQIEHQFVKYVVEQEKEFTDPETGEPKTYKARIIEEGWRDVKISPFDGCGCHEWEFMEQVSAQLGLDYNAIGTQIRLPFMKGFSVYVPFRRLLKEWGYETITDIYGEVHPIDTVDCIWNTSMFKGHSLFVKQYGAEAWKEYMHTIRKYQFKLGISKYSHHIKNLNRYTRMNFQYLQCLDLWNPGYVECFEQNRLEDYDILNPENDGKIIKLARYTTTLFEKIIKGELFYTYKFLGMTNSEDTEPASRYLEAALIHDAVWKDPAVKQYLYRKLKKSIDEAKVGKIYCSGFYHTGVGDMIGYLQYAAGEAPTGCLKEREIYSGNFDCGDILSFRSPLVDPSEVNSLRIAGNPVIDQWFGYFRGQDVVMFNLYDISAPQQGGADFDGDIFFLCNDPILIHSKIHKPVILDFEDKAAALPKPYTRDNIIEYEIMTRDNRIGEITNAATSIENRYTTKEEIRQLYSDSASLLRVFQGKEIDFLKTGVRWHMNAGLRKRSKQLPYFLLYNYPDKMKTYQSLKEKKKRQKEEEAPVNLNAYYSPSPMNELCSYICTWEKKCILWNHDTIDLQESRRLFLNHALDVSDKEIIKLIRRYINAYADELRRHMELHKASSKEYSSGFHIAEITDQFKSRLAETLPLNEEEIANYVIQVSYSSLSISKSLAWGGYGDYIIRNLKSNSDCRKTISIREAAEPTEQTYEYLGKYYTYTEVTKDG
ncbi:MAG: RNA dependent RNA polymerase [Bacteroides sp.]|nr:RNA dependent RNA polymerase [Bacteroides sp.]MCM1549613.1 RNA dependent RNA polymerase [Clostridium sp.]